MSSAPLQFSPYVLKSAGALNAVSTRSTFQGALIHDGTGYGVLHPWPEFGDPPVDTQLELLRQGESSKVIERALHMMRVDGAARREGRALLGNHPIPRCHYSWSHHADFSAQMELMHREAWRAVKSKGFPDLDRMGAWVRRFHEACQVNPLKLRLDFNSSLNDEAFVRWLGELGDELRQRLDFVEDPFEYHADRWSEVQARFGVSLALDKKLQVGSHGFDYAIFKPARREWRTLAASLPEQVKLVFTSAMDHGLAQAFAAYEAIQARGHFADRVDLCGLSTQHLFEPDAFFRSIQVKGGDMSFVQDGQERGLGFTQALEALPWQPL